MFRFRRGRPRDRGFSLVEVMVGSADPAAVSTGVTTDLVTATANVNPFVVQRALTGDSNFDRLLMNLNSTVGAAASGSTRNYNLQFAALNTTVNDPAVPTSCTVA
jgi:hypothetical protein